MPAPKDPEKNRIWRENHSRKMKGRFLGRSLSEETRQKISQANKGRKVSEEVKQKLRERNKALGIKPPSPKGKKFSLEHRQRLGEAQKGNKKGWIDGRNSDINHIREQAKIRAQRRRDTQKNNGGSFTRKEWELLKQKYEYKCAICGKQEPEIKLTKDHIIPVCKGGHSNIDNMQPLCKKCNLSKKDRILNEQDITRCLAQSKE